MDSKLYKNYVSSLIVKRKSVPNSIFDLKRNSSAFMQHFGDFIPKEKSGKIVDLGCGYGVLVWWLNSLGYENVHGVDISESQISLGKSLGIKELIEGDVFEYLNILKDNSCDMIILRDLIEHIEKHMVLDLLEKCGKKLKKNGRLVIQTVNGESPTFGKVFYSDFTHKWVYTSSSLKQILSNSGYRSVNFKPWHPRKKGIGFFRYILWLLTEVIIKIFLYIEGGEFNKIVTVNLIASAKK